MTISSLKQKVSLTTAITVTLIFAMTATTIFSTPAATLAFGEPIALPSEQSSVSLNPNFDIAQDNANTTSDSSRNISSLRITTQSPENGSLDIECGGDLNCKILNNNTVVATTNAPGQNSSTTTVITSAPLNALNQSFTQSLIQSLNQSNTLLPFGGNDFDIFGNQDLDSEIDDFIDRILNQTLGDMQAPLQSPPGLRSASV